MSNYSYNSLIQQSSITSESLTQFKDEPDELHIGNIKIDTSGMRTHRLPEDDEGMTDFNQIPSRMPQSLLDALDGKTADNPDGTSQLVTIRLKNELITRLKNYAKQNEIGYPTYLIEDILEEFAKTHSLE